MADWNGKDKRVALAFTFQEETDQPQQATKPSVKELLKVKRLKYNLIGSTLLWSANAFNWYLMTFFLKYFPGNIFENSFCFALSDIVAFGLVGVVLKKTNVCTGLYIAFWVEFVGGVLFLNYHQDVNLVPVIICFCRVGATMAYNIGYVSPKELFPTLYIATVYGQVNVFAHLVACLGPIVAELAFPMPFVAYLSCMTLAVFATTMI